MHPLIRCISTLLLHIVCTVLSLSPYQTVMIQCRSLTLYTTYYYTMYSIVLLCMYVCIASPYQMLYIYTYYSLSVYARCPLIRQRAYTQRDAVCSIMCSAPFDRHYTYTRTITAYLLCYVEYPLIRYYTQHNRCGMLSPTSMYVWYPLIRYHTYHSAQVQHTTQGAYGIVQHRSFTHLLLCMCMCSIPLLDTTHIHTQCAVMCVVPLLDNTHTQRRVRVRRLCTQELHALRTMCILCMPSPYQMAYITIHIVCFMFVIPFEDNEHNNTECVKRTQELHV